ncbi:hypothetical protein OQA88_3182 [Cercophora sp. LCS_1]
MKPFNLDIIGQPPHLHIYTQLCLCYSVPDDSDAQRQKAAEILSRGLKTLAQRIPWIAGQIIHEPSAEPGNSGIYKIAPWRDAPPLLIRDLRGDPSAPTMEMLRKRNYPMELLDEGLIAPYMTIPGGTAGANPDDPAAVLAVQISHIRGGMLVTFVSQHQVMDLVGQMQVMRLLDMDCRGEGIPEEELEIANRDRSGVIPPIGGDELEAAVEQLGRQKVNASPSVSVPDGQDASTAAARVVWASFSFSVESLTALKAAALETAASPKISTDDALTAFVFQSITRARYHRLQQDPNITCTLGRAVDARRYLNIPKYYPGLLNNMVYHMHSLQETISMPLGNLASELRHAVDPSTSQIGLYTRALASLFLRTPNKGLVSMGANINASCDLMISSWAGADCYNLDFGMGIGAPTAVRRPRFLPLEGLGYLLPRHPSGEIGLVVCLRGEDMEALKDDEEWRRRAVWVE